MKRLIQFVMRIVSFICLLIGIWYSYHIMMYNAFLFFLAAIMLDHWSTISHLNEEIKILKKYSHHHINNE